MRFENVALVAALLIQYSPSCQPFSSIDSRSSPRSVVGKHVEDKGSVVYNNHNVVVRAPIHMSKIDLDLSTDGDINNDNEIGCSSPDHDYERKAEHNRAAAGIMGMATAQFSVAKVCGKLGTSCVMHKLFYNETHCFS